VRNLVKEEAEQERDKILKMSREFGEMIKSLRVKKGYGLRQFAGMVEISPTYLSRMERGTDPPPIAEKIVKIAHELKIDSNQLLALAEKLPREFKEVFTKNPIYTKRVPEFLRLAKEKNLTDNDWKKIIKRLEEE
jgi:transcriptional regulator with XRE-family HTH domain